MQPVDSAVLGETHPPNTVTQGCNGDTRGPEGLLWDLAGCRKEAWPPHFPHATPPAHLDVTLHHKALTHIRGVDMDRTHVSGHGRTVGVLWAIQGLWLGPLWEEGAASPGWLPQVDTGCTLLSYPSVA